MHGSKGSAVFSSRGHLPARSRIYKGQNFVKDDLVWAYPQPEPNPYQVEWDDMIHAVREDLPYSEVERGAMASIVTSMGRMAAHTGRLITMDEMMKHDHEFAPDLANLSFEGKPPIQLKNGQYPVPMPGIHQETRIRGLNTFIKTLHSPCHLLRPRLFFRGAADRTTSFG